MRRLARGPVGALAAIAAAIVLTDAAAERERRLVPDSPQLPVEQVLEEQARGDEGEYAAEPAHDAQRHRADPTRPARFVLGYDFGGFWIITGDGRTTERDDHAAIDGAFDRRAGAWSSGNTVLVSGCCQAADATIDVVVRRAAPPARTAAGADAVTELDVDAHEGRLLLATSPDPPSRIVELPADRYRARIAAWATDPDPPLGASPREHVRIELWPSRAAAATTLVRRPGG
jgi:hypothetical protein